jgi:hypothetical protein
MPAIVAFEQGSELRPRTHEMTIVAQDPSVLDGHGVPLLAQVRVPADRLEPGPRSHRFQVVDYDASTGQLQPPAVLVPPEGFGRGWAYADPFVAADAATVEANPAFHAQNVYAIAARTLGSFEFSLGRRLPWGFGSHQLYLAPHAFAEANAYYSGEDNAVLFGYLPDRGDGRVLTCLSHDVVAHETTHAILDGLRPRFMEPGLPDQAAFHEAFADIIALLSVFSVTEVVEALLGQVDDRGRISDEAVSSSALQHSALFKLAEQLGEATSGERGMALRRSIALDPSEAWKREPAFEEPHRRGEVLVACVMHTLLKMWTKRLVALIDGARVDRARAAEEGSKSAQHLLGMAIRSIDYCPPVEFEFEDFLDAVLASDAVVSPDDEHGYRDSLADAFARFGIFRPPGRIIDLSQGEPLRYDNINFSALRADRDEVFRFLWQNADRLEIDPSYHLQVGSVRPATRVGPDGLVVNETVADYVQMLDASAAELGQRQIEVPDDLPPDAACQIWGGGALIFDQFGMAKFHQTKPIYDPERQGRRLEYLVRAGLRDTSGRFGFSYGTPRGQRFAEFHMPTTRAGESW